MSNEEQFEVDEIEVEEYGKRGGHQRHPHARRYVIRIDKIKYTVHFSHMTGREILGLAGRKPPEDYKLTQKLHGGAARTIGLDQDVNFREPGVERLMTRTPSSSSKHAWPSGACVPVGPTSTRHRSGLSSPRRNARSRRDLSGVADWRA